MGGYLPGLTDAQRAVVLDDAAALGVGWIRTDFSWSQIQPMGPSTYSWAKHDAVVQQATARGLSVLPILDFTPAWARPAGCTIASCGPADPSQFASFAAAAAARYGPLGVHTWEIWNEPNITPFWAPYPDPAAYGALLKVATAAIRSVDPGAVIVSAGISPAATVPGGNISQVDFVTALARSGALAGVDAVGYHPYSYPVLPSHPGPWNAWQIMGATTPSIEGILVANGLAAKKIWITEYGAPTNGPGVGATATDLQLSNNPDHVDENLQAQMATQSVQAAAATPYVGALFWYSDQDLGTSTATSENFFGLRRFDGSHKPAWATFQAAVSTARL
ncbi:MAG: hypothetical protein LC733_01755 [Actinobacteria bacterium]|nr:hypothetical protein [Actinomycetota bacterium]